MYLDFAKISKDIKFEDLLTHLKIEYHQDGGSLIGHFEDGQKFVVSIEKNLFYCPTSKDVKGSVINFFSHIKGVGLRKSAETLLKIKDKKKLPDLELHYSPKIREIGISEEDAKRLNIGVVKQKSIMAGKITFSGTDEEGNLTTYIGFIDGKWTIPKSAFENEFITIPSVMLSLLKRS